MNLNFSVEWKLQFHHHISKEFLGNKQDARIVICLDDVFKSRGHDILLPTTNKAGNFEPITESVLCVFKGKKKVQISDVVIPESFYTKNVYQGNTKNVPKDSHLLFYVYTTHLNDNKIPCQVCVGSGILPLFPCWCVGESIGRGAFSNNGKFEVEIKNRTYFFGTLTVSMSLDENNKTGVVLKKGYQWLNMKRYSESEMKRIINEHAKKEKKWTNSFEKTWGGTNRMIDIFGFIMNGNTIPVGFFNNRKRDWTKKEFGALLYFSLKRYCIENNRRMDDLVHTFQKLPIKQKYSIFCDMMTIIPTSHNYMTDYVVTNAGKYVLMETFQSASKNGSGDCEDFSKEIMDIILSFKTLVLDDKKHPILKELQMLSQMVIPFVALDRTTQPQVNLSSSEISEIIKNFQKNTRTFKNLRDKQMYDCKGSKTRVSAHMNVMAIPILVFCNLLKKTVYTGEDKEKLDKIIKMERMEFEHIFRIYKKKYDGSISVNSIPSIAFEGTGIFNGMNEVDQYMKERTSLFSETSNLKSLAKCRIYKPLGHPDPFYLNILSMVTPYFLQKYNFPMTKFIPSYVTTGSRGQITKTYGITYRDFVEKNTYVIFPKFLLNQKESDVIYATGKRKVRPAYPLKEYNTDDDLEKNEIHFTESYIGHQMNDVSNEENGGEDTYNMKRFEKAIKNANAIITEINDKNRIRISEKNNTTKNIKQIFFVFNSDLFFYDHFYRTLVQELTNIIENVVYVSIEYEFIGEEVKNIILVVSIL